LRGVEEAVREILLKGEPEVSRFNIYACRNGTEEAVGVGGVWEIGDGAVAFAGEEEATSLVEGGAGDEIPGGDWPETGRVREQGACLGSDGDLRGVRGGAGVWGEHADRIKR